MSMDKPKKKRNNYKWGPDEGVKYLPDQAEIRKRAAEVRKGWTATEHAKRLAEPTPDLLLPEGPKEWTGIVPRTRGPKSND